MLASILTRVTGVEDAVQSVVAGMANFARDRKGKGGNANEDAWQQSSGNTVLINDDRVDAEASNPDGVGQKCVSHSHDSDMAQEGTLQRALLKHLLPATVGSHSDKAERHAVSATAGQPAGEPNVALLVNLDSITDQSEDNTPFQVRRRPQRTTPMLVHSQPRMRAVPCARKLPYMPVTATSGEGRPVATPNPNQGAAWYKDPPGYNDATDFGFSYTPILKPPRLQPKTNGVSCQPPSVGFWIWEIVDYGVLHCGHACFVQIPVRPGTKCWILHPGFGTQVIGEAKAGVNNSSRSVQKQLVRRAKDGQQFILFRKIYRHDTPLIFTNDPDIGLNMMCDSVVCGEGRPGQWVRWWSRYLIEMSEAQSLSNA